MGYVRTGEDLPDACPKCRYPLRREFNFCPSCGQRIHDVCPQCRALLEPGWHYCATCGAPSVTEAPPGLLEPDQDAALSQRAEAHNTRGTELYENDEYEEAIREFGAAISLAPDSAIYRTNLAVALSEKGEYERAVSEFKEALRLDPENVSAHLQLGYTYQEMEKPMQAVEAWQKVVALAPDSPEAAEAREALENV